jgi:hypothetical protein
VVVLTCFCLLRAVDERALIPLISSFRKPADDQPLIIGVGEAGVVEVDASAMAGSCALKAV